MVCWRSATAKLVLEVYNGNSLLSAQEQYVSTAGETAWEELAIGMTLPPNTTSIVAYMKYEGGKEVYFDDLKIELNAVPTAMVVQENHYYPFGLGMKGLDYVAPSPNVENKFTFNGQTEKETKLGLNWHETAFRGYDPQLGRFHQIDPLADLFTGITPFQFGYNNPVLFNDPTGLANEGGKCENCTDDPNAGKIKKKKSGGDGNNNNPFGIGNIQSFRYSGKSNLIVIISDTKKDDTWKNFDKVKMDNSEWDYVVTPYLENASDWVGMLYGNDMIRNLIIRTHGSWSADNLFNKTISSPMLWNDENESDAYNLLPSHLYWYRIGLHSFPQESKAKYLAAIFAPLKNRASVLFTSCTMGAHPEFIPQAYMLAENVTGNTNFTFYANRDPTTSIVFDGNSRWFAFGNLLTTSKDWYGGWRTVIRDRHGNLKHSLFPANMKIQRNGRIERVLENPNSYPKY